jgi:hypothetical protein
MRAAELTTFGTAGDRLHRAGDCPRPVRAGSEWPPTWLAETMHQGVKSGDGYGGAYGVQQTVVG